MSYALVPIPLNSAPGGFMPAVLPIQPTASTSQNFSPLQWPFQQQPMMNISSCQPIAPGPPNKSLTHIAPSQSLAKPATMLNPQQLPASLISSTSNFQHLQQPLCVSFDSTHQQLQASAIDSFDTSTENCSSLDPDFSSNIFTSIKERSSTDTLKDSRFKENSLKSHTNILNNCTAQSQNWKVIGKTSKIDQLKKQSKWNKGKRSFSSDDMSDRIDCRSNRPLMVKKSSNDLNRLSPEFDLNSVLDLSKKASVSNSIHQSLDKTNHFLDSPDCVQDDNSFGKQSLIKMEIEESGESMKIETGFENMQQNIVYSVREANKNDSVSRRLKNYQRKMECFCPQQKSNCSVCIKEVSSEKTSSKSVKVVYPSHIHSRSSKLTLGSPSPLLSCTDSLNSQPVGSFDKSGSYITVPTSKPYHTSNKSRRKQVHIPLTTEISPGRSSRMPGLVRHSKSDVTSENYSSDILTPDRLSSSLVFFPKYSGKWSHDQQTKPTVRNKHKGVLKLFPQDTTEITPGQSKESDELSSVQVLQPDRPQSPIYSQHFVSSLNSDVSLSCSALKLSPISGSEQCSDSHSTLISPSVSPQNQRRTLLSSTPDKETGSQNHERSLNQTVGHQLSPSEMQCGRSFFRSSPASEFCDKVNGQSEYSSDSILQSGTNNISGASSLSFENKMSVPISPTHNLQFPADMLHLNPNSSLNLDASLFDNIEKYTWHNSFEGNSP